MEVTSQNSFSRVCNSWIISLFVLFFSFALPFFCVFFFFLIKFSLSVSHQTTFFFSWFFVFSSSQNFTVVKESPKFFFVFKCYSSSQILQASRKKESQREKERKKVVPCRVNFTGWREMIVGLLGGPSTSADAVASRTPSRADFTFFWRRRWSRFVFFYAIIIFYLLLIFFYIYFLGFFFCFVLFLVSYL